MSNVTPQLGVKMSPEHAKAYIDEVNRKVIQRWKERVTNGPFMSQFLEGKLPMSAIKLFFKNWAISPSRSTHSFRSLITSISVFLNAIPI